MTEQSSPSQLTMFLPLLGVGIGGAIAAASAYFTSLVTDRRRQRMELVRLRIHKLEEAFGALQQVQNGYITSFGHAIAMTRYSADIPKREDDFTTAIHRLAALLRVHFPELRLLCTELSQARGVFAHAIFEIYGEPASEGKPRVPNPDHTCRALAEMFQPILDTCTKIEKELERISDEHRAASS